MKIWTDLRVFLGYLAKIAYFVKITYAFICKETGCSSILRKSRTA